MSLSWTSLLKNHGGVWEDTDRAACCVLGRPDAHMTSDTSFSLSEGQHPAELSTLCLWLPLEQAGDGLGRPGEP